MKRIFFRSVSSGLFAVKALSVAPSQVLIVTVDDVSGEGVGEFMAEAQSETGQLPPKLSNQAKGN